MLHTQLVLVLIIFLLFVSQDGIPLDDLASDDLDSESDASESHKLPAPEYHNNRKSKVCSLGN